MDAAQRAPTGAALGGPSECEAMPIRVLILRTAGTNCDEETAYAWALAGATPERLHVRRLIDSPALLDRYAVLTLPGGFSYGDDIAAGRILANQLVHHLNDALRQFVEAGRPILGICNGFQALVRAGLLPGLAGRAGQTVTLANNDTARFEARWICLRAETDRCVFLPKDVRLPLPIAHGEGKLVADDPTLAALRRADHVALRYCDEAGKRGPFPVNPNGSLDDIAGLTDSTGLILGLMPHPERYVHRQQHPAFGAWRDDDSATGRVVFESAVRAIRAR